MGRMGWSGVGVASHVWEGLGAHCGLYLNFSLGRSSKKSCSHWGKFSGNRLHDKYLC